MVGNRVRGHVLNLYYSLGVYGFMRIMNEVMKSKSYSAQPHVMVVDDDERIRSLVSRYLGEQGFIVVEAEDAATARQQLERFEVDAMVVDVMMPGESGLELTNSLRESHDIPVILLTALGETEDRISGLEAGADDYLPKPFEPRELVLRLNAVLRRAAPIAEEELQAFTLGRWRFDPARGELRDTEADDEVLNLTEGEAALLRALAARAGQVLSRDELAEECEVDGGGRTIDVQVTRLRRKIEVDTRSPRYLQTVRGKGYLLRVDG